MRYKFEYLEFFNGVERPDFQKLSGELVIYGAGFQGLLAAFLLKKQNIDVICFADIDEKKQGTLYYDLPVISPEEMVEKYSDKTIIVTPFSLENVWIYLKDELHLHKLLTPFSIFLDFETDEFEKLNEIPNWYHTEGIELHIEKFLIKCVGIVTDSKIYCLETSVTEKCTLRCKNCISLMPCYENPRDFRYEDVLNDILVAIFGRNIHLLHIEGGEPFVWKHLPKLLNELSKHDNIMRIVPVTNGTILPNPELLDALRNPKVTVRISDYGKYSKINELKKIFSEDKIKYWVQLQIWTELSVYSIKENSPEKMKRIITSCCKLQRGGSAMIIDGKLFTCPSQAHLHQLRIFESEEGSFVDLRNGDKESVQKEIDSYLEKRPIFNLCKHCDGRGFTNKEVPPAEQLKMGERLVVKFE